MPSLSGSSPFALPDPELFQLDAADLDFGLYRLFRIKRAEIGGLLWSLKEKG